jgi:hypothetical protein
VIDGNSSIPVFIGEKVPTNLLELTDCQPGYSATGRSFGELIALKSIIPDISASERKGDTLFF